MVFLADDEHTEFTHSTDLIADSLSAFRAAQFFRRDRPARRAFECYAKRMRALFDAALRAPQSKGNGTKMHSLLGELSERGFFLRLPIVVSFQHGGLRTQSPRHCSGRRRASGSVRCYKGGLHPKTGASWAITGSGLKPAGAGG